MELWNPLNRRRTYIQKHQLSPWYRAIIETRNDAGDEFTETAMDYLQTVILTGMRRSEAATLKWDDLDFERLIISAKNTKNGSDHILPMSDYLADLLNRRRLIINSEYVFPGRSKTSPIVNVSKQIDKVQKLSDVEFCIHDLRRNFATAADCLGYPDRTIRRLLNHSQKHDVTAGYLICDVERLRQPMQGITDYILENAGISK
jgi:integrase